MNEMKRPFAVDNPHNQKFVQGQFKADAIRPPEILLTTSTDETLGTEDIPKERYFSPEYHRLEVEHMWKKVWQMACWSQDIPNPGDIHVYDLADINDRLVLGVKNQMSEAELHFLASRLQGARQAAAERGELRFGLPVGYIYDDEGRMVMDPDAEVQAAITDVFAAFRAGGSAFQVVVAFKDRLFPKRAHGGVWAGQLR